MAECLATFVHNRFLEDCIKVCLFLLSSTLYRVVVKEESKNTG